MAVLIIDQAHLNQQVLNKTENKAEVCFACQDVVGRVSNQSGTIFARFQWMCVNTPDELQSLREGDSPYQSEDFWTPQDCFWFHLDLSGQILSNL